MTTAASNLSKKNTGSRRKDQKDSSLNSNVASFQSFLNQDVDLDDLPLAPRVNTSSFPSLPSSSVSTNSSSPLSVSSSSSSSSSTLTNGVTKSNFTPALRSTTTAPTNWDSRKITEAVANKPFTKNPPLGISSTGVAASTTNTTASSLISSSNLHSSTASTVASFQGASGFFLEHSKLLPSYRPHPSGAHQELSSALKSIRNKTNVKITLSVQALGSTFLLDGPEEECSIAKRLIYSQLTPKSKITLSIPANMVGQVVGSKGAVIQKIQARTFTKIDFQQPHTKKNQKFNSTTSSVDPSVSNTATLSANESASSNEEIDSPSSEFAPSPMEEFIDITEPTVDVIISGDLEGVTLAKSEIQAIIGSKLILPTIQVSNASIPTTWFPFLFGPYQEKVKDIETQFTVAIEIPKHFDVPFLTLASSSEPSSSSLALLIKGDRSSLGPAFNALKELIHSIEKQTNRLSFQLPYARHKLLVGPQACYLHQLLNETGCVVEFPTTYGENSISIRGPTSNLAKALAFITTQCDSVVMLEMNLSIFTKKDVQAAQVLLKYLQQHEQAFLAQLQAEHQTTLHFPSLSSNQQHQRQHMVELTGFSLEKVSACRDQFTQALLSKGLFSYCHLPVPKELFSNPSIQSVLTKFENAATFTSTSNGTSSNLFEPHILPPSSFFNTQGKAMVPEDVLTLIVFDPTATEPGKKGHLGRNALDTAKKELMVALEKLPKFHSELWSVPSKYHSYFLGDQHSTLVSILQQCQQFHVNMTVVVGHTLIYTDSKFTVLTEKKTGFVPTVTCDQVLLRGLKPEVTQLKQALQLVLDEVLEAEATEKIKKEIPLPTKFALSILGPGRSTLAKYRKHIGIVKIDVISSSSTSSASGNTSSSQGNSGTLMMHFLGTPKAVNLITKEILDKVKQLEDFTVTHVMIPHQFHRNIVGEQWKQVKDLEQQYQVKIHFPSKQDKVNADQITVKGPSKGVQQAVKALKKYEEHEELHSFTDTLSILSSLVPNIVGKNGSKLMQLREATQARIDLPQKQNGPVQGGKKSFDSHTQDSLVQFKGTKEQVQLAKAVLTATSQAMIRAGFTWESETVSIPEMYHRRLVGSNGSNLNQLLASFHRHSSSTKDGTSTTKTTTTAAAAAAVATAQANEKKTTSATKTKTKPNAGGSATTPSSSSSVSDPSKKVAELVKSIYGFDMYSKEPLSQVDVRFPKGKSDEVEIRAATKELLDQVKAKLLNQVNQFADETVIVLHVPVSLHPALIGKNGSGVKEIQSNYKVRIDFKPFVKPTEVPFETNRSFEGAGPMGSIYVSGPSEQAKLASEMLLDRTPCSIAFSLPVAAKPHVMGHQNHHLRRLRTKHHVTVNLPGRLTNLTSSMNNDNDDQEPMETWILQGSYDNVQAGLAELQSLLNAYHHSSSSSSTSSSFTNSSEDLSNEPSCYFEIHDIDLNLHRLIIGAQGSKIRELREVTQCQIDLKRGDKIIRISGPSQEHVLEAEKLIREAISQI